MMLAVVPDRFATQADSLGQSLGAAASSVGKNHIRRPVRGIVLKEDTFATLRMVAGNGGNLKLVDAGSNRLDDSTGGNNFMQMPDGKRATDIYSNFLIQQIQEERVEKQQIIETFGEPYIFLFGERARVINITGVLANTFDFNWEAEWWYNYDNFIRGTRCIENDARIFLSFDNTLVGGYIIAASTSKTSDQRNYVNFQFQLFVTSYVNYSQIGDPSAIPPGGRSFFTNVATTSIGATAQGLLSPEAAAQFRPQLLSDFGRFPLNTNGLKIGSSALLVDTSAIAFSPAVNSALQFISDAWNEGVKLVNTVTKAIDDFENLMTNSRVRVPIGFEGALAFNEDANVHLIDVAAGGVIKFTTFDQNTDEYVGSSDHYGSADPSLTYLQSLTSPSQASSLARAQELVTTAETIWKANGLTIPTEQMSGVSSFLISKGLGLVGVGATTAWTTAAAPGGGINPDGRLPLSILGDTGVRSTPATPE